MHPEVDLLSLMLFGDVSYASYPTSITTNFGFPNGSNTEALRIIVFAGQVRLDVGILASLVWWP